MRARESERERETEGEREREPFQDFSRTGGQNAAKRLFSVVIKNGIESNVTAVKNAANLYVALLDVCVRGVCVCVCMFICMYVRVRECVSIYI